MRCEGRLVSGARVGDRQAHQGDERTELTSSMVKIRTSYLPAALSSSFGVAGKVVSLRLNSLL